MIRAVSDHAYYYEPRVEVTLESSLRADPPVNAGFVLAERIPYDDLQIDKRLRACRDHWGPYTEQTIMAYFLQQMNGSLWRDDEMKITADDSREFFGDPVSHGWRGRHYISPHRHLFWRDAVMLQIRRAAALLQTARKRA